MSRKKLLKSQIILIVAAVILVFLISAATIYVLASTTIYRGVSCCGTKLGGLTQTQAVQALQSKLGEQPLTGKIFLTLDGKERTILTDEIETEYSYEKTVQNALAYGRNKNFFLRVREALIALFGGKELPLSFTCNKELLYEKTDEMLSGIGTPVKEYSYEVRDNKFYITNGIPGDMPDQDEVVASIENAVGMRDFDTRLVFDKSQRLPQPIDAEALYQSVHVQVQDAKYEREKDDVIVVPSRFGVDFDVKTANEIINNNKNYGESFEIPAEITTPAFTTQQAQERLFAQTLGSYKSNYNAGDTSRSSNIHLAAQLINDTVLMPGEEFSYNNTVGERTSAAGFKVAHVYMNNEVADGIGGGICQVSSTLYCTALYANVEITERIGHQLPVSYVPLGQDATVDYGNIDFKFKNNTSYPIKILASAGGGTVYASISGYRDIAEKVEIIPVRTGTIPPVEVEEKDETLTLGERKIEKQGAPGSVVETYKVVTVNGTAGQRQLISRSNYAAGKTIVKVGTKPPEASPSPSPQPFESAVPSPAATPDTNTTPPVSAVPVTPPPTVRPQP